MTRTESITLGSALSRLFGSEVCTGRLEEVGQRLGFESVCARAEEGKKLVIPEEALDPSYDRQNEFDIIIDLGDLLTGMKGHTVVPEERWQQAPAAEGVTILTNGYTYKGLYDKLGPFFPDEANWANPEIISGRLEKVIKECQSSQGNIYWNAELGMAVCSILTNHPEFYNPEKNEQLKFLYTEALQLVADSLKADGYLDEETVKVGVVRAGAVAYVLFYGQEDPELINCRLYEAKRLPAKDGTFAVGEDDPYQVISREEIDGQVVEIDEVFLASGATMVAFMLDCHTQGIGPAELKIVAPFIDQHGAELVKRVAEALNWKVRIIGAKLYYSLNPKLYVMIGRENLLYGLLQKIYPGRDDFQAGGDAGDGTEDTMPKVTQRLVELGFVKG